MSTITDILFTALNFRHACKTFDPAKKISDEDFNTILEAGRLSPSSFGFEPWEFLVIQNAELREEIKAHAWGGQGQLPTASHVVVLLARQPEAANADSPYIRQTIMHDMQELPDDMAAGRAEKFREFQQKDFDYGDNQRARFEWAARQSYIALGNMMTAAALLGIDSCPMEGFDKNALEALLEKKGLMDRKVFGAAVMVAFGHRVKDPRPKTRRAQSAVVKWIK